MRFAVLSDIHSNLEALNEVLKHVGTVDQYLCLGDIVGYGANPNEVIELVKQRNILAVRGNHDEAALTGLIEGFNPTAATAVEWTGQNLSAASLAFLSRLPLRFEFEIDQVRVHMVHGSPKKPLQDYVYPDESRELLQSFLKATKSDLLLLGHTHIPMNVEAGPGRVLNPGSVGQPRDGDRRASYALLDAEGGEVACSILRVEYNVEDAARKILEAGLPSFDAERLYEGL